MEVSRLAMAGLSLMASAAPLWATETEQPQTATAALPPVNVWAPALTQDGDRRAALRLDVSAVELPLAYSTVSANWLQGQGARTLTDALSQVPGVTDTGTEWTLTMRGFSANAMKNGILDASPLAIQMVPLIGLERVEVIKGPEAIVAGQSAGYGGVVNVVTKQPQARRTAEVELQAGSNGRFGAGVDLGGALTADGRWSARLVAARDREQPDALGYIGPYQTYAAASLAFRDRSLGTDLQLSHETNDQGLKNFWSVYYDPLTSQLGQQGKPLRLGDNANRSAEVQTQTTRVAWTQQLQGNWHLGLKWQHQVSDFHLTGGLLGLVTAYPTVLGVTPDGTDQRRNSSLRADLHGAFETGTMQHRLLLAMDHEQGDVVRTQAQPSQVDLYRALDGQLLQPLLSAGPRVTIGDYSTRETGVLVMDHITWGRWHAVAGVRRLSYRPENHLAQSAESYNATLPNLGLVVRASDSLSWYANTAKAFRANTGLLEFATGQQVRPESARQWELGVKHQSSDSGLTWSLATYHITQQNRAVADTAHSTGSLAYYLSAQGVKSRGLEAELSGQWTDRLSLRATYAYGEVTLPAGQPPVPFARHIFGLNATYDLQQPGRGVWVGASLQGRSAAHNLDTVLNIDTISPAMVQLDVFGGYRNDAWSLVVGIKNLSNRRNYTLTSGTNGAGFLLQPRQAYATLSYRY